MYIKYLDMLLLELYLLKTIDKEMRKPGIEPGAQRWQRWILPLNHLRLTDCWLSVGKVILYGLLQICQDEVLSINI